jgi:hypothetical protein
MKKFIINNLKYAFSFVLGAIVFAGTAVFAYNFGANEVRHIKSDNTETSVDLALNELYQMYDADNIILSKIYPVGSYYISASNTSPADIFGGTWVKVEGKFILSSSSSYTVGSTGGSASNTLAANQIPTLSGISGSTSTNGSHNHSVKYIDGNRDMVYNGFAAGSSFGGVSIANTSTGGHLYTRDAGNHSHTFTNGTYTNSNQQSVDNMPPYEVANIWRRTA